MSDYEGFGLVSIKAEGCAIHPDEIDIYSADEADLLTDDQYLTQLKKYIADTGHKDCFCCRPNLLEKALNNE